MGVWCHTTFYLHRTFFDMSHFLPFPKPQPLHTIAGAMIMDSKAAGFVLTGLAREAFVPVPHTPPKADRFVARIAAADGQQFSGVAHTPFGAVALALCYEKIFRQGWG
jgi:hypothetical protein